MKNSIYIFIILFLTVQLIGCVDESTNDNNKNEIIIAEAIIGNWTHTSNKFWYVFNNDSSFIWYVKGESYHIDGTYRLSDKFIEITFNIGINEKEYRTYIIEFITYNKLKLTDLYDETFNIFNRV
jgi:hypothetical protein